MLSIYHVIVYIIKKKILHIVIIVNKIFVLNVLMKKGIIHMILFYLKIF